MKNIFIILLQSILAIIISPLVSGFIRKLKNSLRMKRGQPLLQPYYNLIKYFKKDEVVSEHTSFIFFITPYLVLGSMITVLLFIPVFHSPVSAFFLGDALVLFFMLSFGRFFLALAALDSGSAFGGMGSSREMFISGLLEPLAIMAITVVAWQSGTFNLQEIQKGFGFSFSGGIALFALLILIIAETSRIPVDNQETHLELTMVHEAMLLEYSGRSFALLELASYVKQFILFSLFTCIFLPLPLNFALGWVNLITVFVFFILKIAVLSIFIAFLEIALAKMRLFRVVDFLGLGFTFSIIAFVARLAGY